MPDDYPETDSKLVDQSSSLSARAQAILTVRLKDALEKQTVTLIEHATVLEKQAASSDALARRIWRLNVWLLVAARRARRRPGIAEALLAFSLRERLGAVFTRGSQEPIDLRASR